MLRFKVSGIPVRVGWSFGVIALIGPARYGIAGIGLWTLAAFIAILAHELGHALAARTYGATGIHIVLFGFGGYTAFDQERPLPHKQSFFVTAAGSAVGIALGGPLLLISLAGLFDGLSVLTKAFVDYFIFTSLGWGVLNWVPIFPFDGGRMLTHFVAMVSPRRAALISRTASWVTVLVVVPIAVRFGWYIAAVLVVVFALAGTKAHGQVAASPPDGPSHGDQDESPPADADLPVVGPTDDDPPRQPDLPDFPI